MAAWPLYWVIAYFIIDFLAMMILAFKGVAIRFTLGGVIVAFLTHGAAVLVLILFAMNGIVPS
jgi:hypothetical protein